VLVGSFVIASLIGTLAVFIFTKEDSPKEIMQDVVQDQVLTTGVGEDVWNPDGEPYVEFFAPENSFGISYKKDINQSYWDGKWNNSISWTLWKSNNKVTWEQTDEEGTLDIIKDTDENGSYKFMVNWTCQDTAYYQVRFIVDGNVTDYNNDSGYQYNMTYQVNETETYDVFFNWSDLIESEWDEFLEYDMGVNDSGFLFNITSIGKIPKNTHISLDPIFGNNNQGSGSYQLENVNVGTAFNFTGTTGSHPENLVGYITVISGYTLDIQFAIYNYSVPDDVTTLIANTSSEPMDDGDGTFWYNLSIPNSETISLTYGEWYYFCGWGQLGVGNVFLMNDGDTGAESVGDGDNDPFNWENPYTGEVSFDETFDIYCYYTEPAVGASWQDLSYMQFNISFSSSSDFNDLNTLQYNISLSNTSVFNDLFGLQFNLSFSNTTSYQQINSMSYNISMSNTTQYQQIPSMSFNISFSNSLTYETIPSMTYNVSFGNTTTWQDLNTLQFNLSFSNTSTEQYFYVSNSGADSNNGTHPDTPWENVSYVSTQLNEGLIKAGDDVYFNRGDTFNDSVLLLRTGGVSSSNPMVIGAYGTGANPIINAPAGVPLQTPGGGTDHWIIENITIIYSSQIQAIQFNGGGTGQHENVTIRNITALNDSIALKLINYYTVDNCTAMAITVTGDGNGDIANGTIRNCVVGNSSGDGISLHREGGAPAGTNIGWNHKLINCSG